ncbi:MAG: carbohydrate ABC transporter permease [Anaerolineae bacterium]|nr:carbohydrate ABC transporter permease [Anaerolineae bacterium]
MSATRQSLARAVPTLGGGIRWGRVPWRKIIALALIIPLAVIFAIPFYWMVISSLKTKDEVFAWPMVWFPKELLWGNYPEAWATSPFTAFYRNTAILTGLRVTGTILSCTSVAYAFARLRTPLKGLLFTCLLSTMMLPHQVTLIPTFVIWYRLGALDTYWPLVLPSFFGSAYHIFLLRQFFLSIPDQLGEAAKIDGSSEWGILWRIYLPLSKPALAVVSIFTFQWSWGDFFSPLIYLIDVKKMPISYGIFLFRGQAQYGGIMYWHYIMAMSTVMILPPIILFFTAQKYFIQGIVMTGIKG